MNIPIQSLVREQHDLWDILPRGKYPVKFDDGIVKTLSSRDILLSQYAWSFIKTVPTTTKIYSHQHFSHFIKDGVVREQTIKALFNDVFWSTIDQAGLTDNRSEINRLLYKLTLLNDDYFHGVLDNCPEYVSSMDILDLILVHDHPPIVAIRDRITDETHMDDVASAQKEVAKIILDGIYNEDGTLNSVSAMCRSGMLTMSQILQTVFMRGYVIEVDGSPIPYCLKTPLIEGIQTVEDYAFMSRDLSLSVGSNKADLGNATEKLTKMGYITLAIDQIMDEDCGSNHYATRIITEDNFMHHIGKYYVADEKNDTLDYVRVEDKDKLVNRTLKMRSSFFCDVEDPHAVCCVCYGKLAESLPPGPGVGKIIQSILGEPFVQLILKLKHVIASMTVSNVVLNNTAKKYFKCASGDLSLYLKSNKSHTSVKMRISRDDVAMLNTIFTVDNVSKLSINMLSEIYNITLIVKLSRKVNEEQIHLSDKLPFYLSFDLIKHLKENPAMLSASTDFITLDITGLTMPILTQENKIETFKDKGNSFVSMIERSGKMGKKVSEFEVEGTLAAVTEMVHEDLGIPISMMEVMILPFIIQRIDRDENYALTRLHHVGAIHGSVSDISRYRSISTRLLRGEGLKVLLDPESYLIKRRVSTPMDVGIMPRETVKRYKRVYKD